MAVSGRPLLFSSLLRRAEHNSVSSTLSRKMGAYYGQGQIAQLPSFSACFVKCTQSSSSATCPLTFKHGLTIEDNLHHHQVQHSLRGFTKSPRKYGRLNQFSTYGMSGRRRVNETIGCSSRGDRSQMHTTSARTFDGTNASQNTASSPILSDTRISWLRSAYEADKSIAYYAGRIKVAAFVQDAEKEETTGNLLKDRLSNKSCPLPTLNSDLLVQQSAGIIIDEMTEQTSSAKQSAQKIIVENTTQTSCVKVAGLPTNKMKESLTKIYDKVLVVDNVTTAKQIVMILTTKYRNLIHACGAEKFVPINSLMSTVSASSYDQSSALKRKRGRPRKHKISGAVSPQADSSHVLPSGSETSGPPKTFKIFLEGAAAETCNHLDSHAKVEDTPIAAGLLNISQPSNASNPSVVSSTSLEAYKDVPAYISKISDEPSNVPKESLSGLPFNFSPVVFKPLEASAAQETSPDKWKSPAASHHETMETGDMNGENLSLLEPSEDRKADDFLPEIPAGAKSHTAAAEKLEDKPTVAEASAFQP